MKLRSEEEIGWQLDVLHRRLFENNQRHEQLISMRKRSVINAKGEDEIAHLCVEMAIIKGQIHMLEFVFGIEDAAVA